MSTVVYTVLVSYQAPGGQPANSVVVGVHSSEEKARAALEDFKEGTLGIEFPDAEITAESIERCVIDQAYGAN